MQPDHSFTLHDLAHFPIVLFRSEAATPGYAALWQQEMDALLAQGRPFVLLFPDGRAEEEHEDRKQRALWLKQNREGLAALCLSLITVEPDAGKRLALEAQSAMAARAFGIPMAVSPSPQQAHAMAQALIAASTA
ncbi:hypothetical protein [Novosphingobium terrae]|uniref:hypothetical protein n=1 Tax=Novosphingobium terrae TaxID=2726189 RepID=UPI00197FD7B3|nr:hypothetical protein [Novosphingobium terrae]